MNILPKKIQLYIPSLCNDGTPIENRGEVLTTAANKINMLFGGSTVVEGLGTYTTPDGKLVTEKVSIIESWFGGTENDFYDVIYGERGIFSYAFQLRKTLKQDSIFLVVNSVAFLIDDDNYNREALEVFY